jgi:hypothetical protein
LGSTEGFIAAAESCLGVPYVFGGVSPQTGLDCSGLVYYSAGTQGVAVPRTTQGEWYGLTAVDSPIPGDLILFDVPSDGPPQPQHVGIYLAPNTMIQAPHTGLSVMYSTIPNESEISVMGYRRIDFGPAPPPTPSPITPEEILDMATTDPDTLVRFAYRLCLHREPDASGYATFMAFVKAGGTLGQVMQSLQDSAEGKTLIEGERKVFGL